MNLVSDTMGDGISSSAWSRSTSKPEKPTQGAPARAGCPTPAAKSAPSGAHSAQITQVCEWRTRPIAWPSRRRNRCLNSGLRFLTLDARPPRARTLPKPQINFHSCFTTAKSKCCCSIWQRKGPGTKSISVIAIVAWYKINFIGLQLYRNESELIRIPGFVPFHICRVLLKIQPCRQNRHSR